MIYIITGEDIVSSRNKLVELLKDKTNVVRLDGKGQTIAEIEMAFDSGSLFETERTIVVEGFLKVKPQEKFVELVSNFQKDEKTDVILWDEVELSAKISYKSAKIFSFPFPKYYFVFLDSLSPKSSEETLRILHELLKTTTAEQILYSIIKRIRQLLVIKSANYAAFEEFKRMQSWQIGKLRSQAGKWTEDQLSKAFIQYADLDEKIKTSGLTMELSNHLDIILLSDLN